jgi:hypothetical protein
MDLLTGRLIEWLLLTKRDKYTVTNDGLQPHSDNRSGTSQRSHYHVKSQDTFQRVQGRANHFPVWIRATLPVTSETVKLFYNFGAAR